LSSTSTPVKVFDKGGAHVQGAVNHNDHVKVNVKVNVKR
jgi:hypothetical protein